MKRLQILRIVVASPEDVQAERDILEKVVAELNHGAAAMAGLRLEIASGKTDAYPGFNVEGPQALIDSVLRIKDCDLLIVIFWKRPGSPNAEANSGTEHEFRIAYEAWRRRGSPQIMVYFKQKAHRPTSKAEMDQWARVLDFQKNFPKEGLWWSYKGELEFERLVRNHLSRFIFVRKRTMSWWLRRVGMATVILLLSFGLLNPSIHGPRIPSNGTGEPKVDPASYLQGAFWFDTSGGRSGQQVFERRDWNETDMPAIWAKDKNDFTTTQCFRLNKVLAVPPDYTKLHVAVRSTDESRAEIVEAGMTQPEGSEGIQTRYRIEREWEYKRREGNGSWNNELTIALLVSVGIKPDKQHPVLSAKGK